MYCNVAQCNALQCNVVWCSVISINVLLCMYLFIQIAHMFCKRAFPSILSCLAKPTCTCPMTWFPLWFSITVVTCHQANHRAACCCTALDAVGDTQPAEVYFLVGWSKDWPFSTVYDAIICHYSYCLSSWVLMVQTIDYVRDSTCIYKT